MVREISFTFYRKRETYTKSYGLEEMDLTEFKRFRNILENAISGEQRFTFTARNGTRVHISPKMLGKSVVEITGES